MRELDSKMNAYIGRILGLRPTSDDTPATFYRRRNQATKEASCRLDLMSSRHWALKVTTWIEHCLRHPGCPAARLLTCQDPLWLQTLRVLSGSLSIDAGQTRSRAGPGKPKRYLGPWYLMIDFQNSEHDKGQSRANAEIVWTAGWYGRLSPFRGLMAQA